MISCWGENNNKKGITWKEILSPQEKRELNAERRKADLKNRSKDKRGH